MGVFYEAGTYENVEIVGQGFTQSSTKKTPGFFLAIRPGQYDRTITWWLPEGKEDAIDRMLAGLRTLELPVDSIFHFDQLDPRSSSHVSFAGQTVTVVCKHEAGEGGMFEKWDAPYIGRVQEELDDASIRKLDAMFGHKLKGAERAAKPTPKPAASKKPTHAEVARSGEANHPAVAEGEEIPF
jgi:hypothetical protein